MSERSLTTAATSMTCILRGARWFDLAGEIERGALGWRLNVTAIRRHASMLHQTVVFTVSGHPDHVAGFRAAVDQWIAEANA